MKKRIISFALTVLMLVAVIPAMSVPAFADDGYISIVIGEGDSIYDICQHMGLDYQAVKNTIMLLNGWASEAQMSRLRVGDEILMPTSADYLADSQPVYQNGQNEIAYYVVAYEIQPGDTIESIYSAWGLRYEKFVNLIRLLNCIQDLDGLVVGAVYYLPTTVLYQPALITVLAHTMQWGETAYGVFRSFGIDYSSYAELLWRFNNGADLTNIALGDKLLIPQI